MQLLKVSLSPASSRENLKKKKKKKCSIQPVENATFFKEIRAFCWGQWKGEAMGSIELLIAKHRKMLIRFMLRKALTHQGASLQTLSWDHELLLANIGERLTWIVPKCISCHYVKYCLGNGASCIVLEVICMAKVLETRCSYLFMFKVHFYW